MYKLFHAKKKVRMFKISIKQKEVYHLLPNVYSKRDMAETIGKQMSVIRTGQSNNYKIVELKP